LAPTLRVQGLQVAYPVAGAWPWRRSFRAVVHGVALDLAPGRTLALVGPSGCGKTSTAKAIVQLLVGRAQVSGRVVLAGVELTGLRGAASRQARALCRWCSRTRWRLLTPA
jgi:peptide/nickel transport system ATP-binding protein